MFFKDSGDDFHQLRTSLIIDFSRIHVLESLFQFPEALFELIGHVLLSASFRFLPLGTHSKTFGGCVSYGLPTLYGSGLVLSPFNQSCQLLSLDQQLCTLLFQFTDICSILRESGDFLVQLLLREELTALSRAVSRSGTSQLTLLQSSESVHVGLSHECDGGIQFPLIHVLQLLRSKIDQVT